MPLYNPLLPKQGTLGQSPNVSLPKVVIPGQAPGPGTGTPPAKPTIDKIFGFLGDLAGTLFPSGVGGGQQQPPPYYPTVPAPPESILNPVTIGLGLGIYYLASKK